MRSYQCGTHTTLSEHMPKSYRAHAEWSPKRLIQWGESIGANTGAIVEHLLRSKPHPERGYRACLGLLALGRQYGTSEGWYLANGDLAPCAINKGLDVAQRIVYSSRFFSLQPLGGHRLRHQLTGKGIGRQCGLHQGNQAVDPAAHVRKTGYQPDAYARRKTQHGRSSSRISTRKAFASIWPDIFTCRPPEISISMHPFVPAELASGMATFDCGAIEGST